MDMSLYHIDVSLSRANNTIDKDLLVFIQERFDRRAALRSGCGIASKKNATPDLLP